MAKFNDKRNEIKNIISALFTALWYDASSNYVVEVVKDVKSMIISGGNREVADDALYIFKVLVLMYGDYGVAPAVGWIEEDIKSYILNAIEDWSIGMSLESEVEE